MRDFDVTIQYSAEDLQQAYHLHYRKAFPVGSKLLLILGGIAFVFGLGLLLYSYLRLNFTNWFAWFLIIYAVLMVAFYYWRYYSMGKRMFKKMTDFQYPFQYHFSDKGIKVSNPNVNSDNKWSYYEKHIMDDDMILLYPNKLRFNFFARRHFEGAAFDELREFVTKNVKSYK
jgi:hypothetical protein